MGDAESDTDAGPAQPQKGHLLVVDALAELLPKHPSLLLVIGGRGPARDAIEARIRALGVDESVILLGEVEESDKADLYRAADVFCMPSEIDEESFEVEGFGIVYLEAAAAGTVAVGSRTGGAPDAIEDGVTGFLVPPGDRRALVGLLERILSRPSELGGMRAPPRARACEEFDWPKRVDRLLTSLGAAMGWEVVKKSPLLWLSLDAPDAVAKQLLTRGVYIVIGHRGISDSRGVSKLCARLS